MVALGAIKAFFLMVTSPITLENGPVKTGLSILGKRLMGLKDVLGFGLMKRANKFKGPLGEFFFCMCFLKRFFSPRIPV
jgi:hypothetical protein